MAYYDERPKAILKLDQKTNYPLSYIVLIELWAHAACDTLSRSQTTDMYLMDKIAKLDT